MTGGTATFQGVFGSLNYQLTGLGTEQSANIALSGSANLFFDLLTQMQDQTVGLQIAQDQIVMDTARQQIQQGFQQGVQMTVQDVTQNKMTTPDKAFNKWDDFIHAPANLRPPSPPVSRQALWGSVSPSSDTLQPDQSLPLTITADPTDLNPGIYQPEIDITSTPFATAANPNPPSTTQTRNVDEAAGDFPAFGDIDGKRVLLVFLHGDPGDVLGEQGCGESQHKNGMEARHWKPSNVCCAIGGRRPSRGQLIAL